ncbi:hypothetical protein L3556_08285 [Candidatus Synechococcus calcipolaris G9]|uniref:Uncharacterized protein n=1 Tax=Candidatus Synechococcus calcipolaris G9 TaxID=1497997 RepID=A0ABT6EZA9_9SYNE|nr:hypothetical protein [Candidatus Synechococcus calcipolaris]MDG2990924.1 hypothetical protein [Candidatus Synechococcus calcipolaris G9]
MTDLGQQVKYLQEQLRIAQNRAAEWQKRYEVEAQQRRQDAELHRQTLLNSKSSAPNYSANRLTLPPSASESGERAIADGVANEIQAQVLGETDPVTLQAQLIQALLDNQRLTQALESERASHAKTRQSLTTALGDTIETLQQRRRLRPPKSP